MKREELRRLKLRVYKQIFDDVDSKQGAEVNVNDYYNDHAKTLWSSRAYMARDIRNFLPNYMEMKCSQRRGTFIWKSVKEVDIGRKAKKGQPSLRKFKGHKEKTANRGNLTEIPEKKWPKVFTSGDTALLFKTKEDGADIFVQITKQGNVYHYIEE